MPNRHESESVPFFSIHLAAARNYFAADARNIFAPPPAREFRAAWITEVAANPDWPSKPGLTTAQQKAELVALLDRAQQLHLNAVILPSAPGVRRRLRLGP